jgi:hypothetical protein
MHYITGLVIEGATYGRRVSTSVKGLSKSVSNNLKNFRSNGYTLNHSYQSNRHVTKGVTYGCQIQTRYEMLRSDLTKLVSNRPSLFECT